MFTMYLCAVVNVGLLSTSGVGVDVRGECLRKLSSHAATFELGFHSNDDAAGVELNPDSEVCVESNSHSFGIRPFFIPKG